MNRFDAVQAVLEAVDKADISERDKRRVRFAVRFRPRLRQEITEYVMQECAVEGIVSEDGTEAVVEWIIIVSYVIQLIAGIIKIIQFFRNR